VPGEQRDQNVVALRELPLLGGEAGGAGALDVPGAVIDEQDAGRLGSDAARCGGEKAAVGLGHAQVARIAADVEQGVVAEGGAHVRRPEPVLVGAEMDSVAVRAQGAHQRERPAVGLDAVPHRVIDVLGRRRHPELDQPRREQRQVVALPGEHRLLVLPGAMQELLRPVAHVRLHRRVPAPGDALQDTVGVEQHVPDRGCPAGLVACHVGMIPFASATRILSVSFAIG
jgi:hypothetical protein